MAVTQAATKIEPDAAPLWLPRDDIMVVEQASSRPPDLVEGYGLKNRIVTALLGSQWKTITTLATLITSLLFVVILVQLAGAGIGTLFKIAFYQSWTILAMLAVSARVRSITIGTVARYWLAGMFIVAALTHFLDQLITPFDNTSSSNAVWILAPANEIFKALLLAAAVFAGRRIWRHPGLSDLMILGFAVGGGYAFYRDGLWESAQASGFEANAGFFVPSIFQPDGLFVVGHAVWASLIGFAIGLILLHRHRAWAVVVANAVVFAVIGDHMAIHDDTASLDVVRQLLFNGKLVALIFLVAVAASVLLDHRRIASAAARDHLFPADQLQRHLGKDHALDLVQSYVSGRYRRRRNGAYNTVLGAGTQWPPHSEHHPAPVAEMARLGRAAGVAVGPGTSSTGWAPDPETTGSFRFVGPNGFTPYVASELTVDALASLPAPAVTGFMPTPAPPQPVAATTDGDEEDGEPSTGRLAQILAKRQQAKAEVAAQMSEAGVGAAPTTRTMTSLSTPKARPEAIAATQLARPTDFLQYVGLGVVAAGLYALVRLLTAGDAATSVLEGAYLSFTPTDYAIILGSLGAVAAAVMIRGRDQAALGAGWEVGPGDDPVPERPQECEA